MLECTIIYGENNMVVYECGRGKEKFPCFYLFPMISLEYEAS